MSYLAPNDGMGMQRVPLVSAWFSRAWLQPLLFEIVMVPEWSGRGGLKKKVGWDTPYCTTVEK